MTGIARLKISALLAATLILGGWLDSFAQEVVIVFTGSTHASLYHCDCPVELDGGVARRATMIKQLRQKNPDLLLLDSGSSFAAGEHDRYTKDMELDKERTRINLKAMEMMRYDGIAVGEDEFNFGKDFLETNIKNIRLNYLSSNIASDKVGYIIKEAGGVKIGVVAITSLAAMPKAGGLEFIDPRVALKRSLDELKKKKVNFAVLLSNLGEAEDRNLLKKIPGVDIVISSISRDNEEPMVNIGPTLYLRPFWQGRRLSKLTFLLKDNAVSGPKFEEIRLSDKIKDDPDILKILPKCFYDRDCQKPGLSGACLAAGTPKASCKFTPLPQYKLQIVTPRKPLRVVDYEGKINYLRRFLPGLKVMYVYYPGREAERLIRDTKAKVLPIYIMGSGIEKEKRFAEFRDNLEKSGNYYMLKPEFSGISLFLGRETLKGKLDLFLSLYDPGSGELLDAIREFNPKIHFLAREVDGKFEAKKGNLEIEEYLRSVCVYKLYPQAFLNYISCRARNIDSSWWEDCLMGLDSAPVKKCAQGEDGRKLLREDASLGVDLGVSMGGPTFLLDNHEVFTTSIDPQGKITKDSWGELIKLLKR